MNIYEELRKLLEDSLSIIYEKEEIKKDTHIVDDLGFNSIMIMQLFIKIEETFEINIDEDIRYEDVLKVENMLKYIQNKLEKKNDL